MISTRNIVISAASLVAFAQALTVNTPASAVQCQPLALGWGEGTAPYYVSIIPGGQPSAAALQSFPQQSGTSYTWMVDIASGTAITVKVVDSTGDTNYSDQITVQAGTSTDCASSGAVAPAASSSAAAGSTTASTPAGSSSSSSRTNLSSARTSGTSTTVSSKTSASGVAPNAAANTSSSSNTGSAMTGAKAGFGLLVSGLIFALAA